MKKKPLHFYHTMHYPVPTPEEWFYYNEKTSSDTLGTGTSASRPTINTTTKEFIQTITTHKKVYTTLPFVTHIYLCNSITFNAVKKDSDIDLTIITQEKRIRTARLYSAILFASKGIKRNKKTCEKQFCLSFYMTHDHCNLYHIKRPHTDTYLAYWIAHSIPLYTKTGHNPNHLLIENNRVRAHLPNLPNHLPCQLHHDRPYQSQPSRTRNIIETIHSSRWGDIMERLIKTIRLPIIRRKKKKSRHHRDIITSDTMLKFHHDKRDMIYDAMQIHTEKKQ